MTGEEGQGVAEGAAGAARREDPFGETSNPAWYVPRDATEEALRAVEVCVQRARPVALTSPPGLGKSLILRLLAERLGDPFRCAFLPYAAMPIEELCAWILGILDESASDDPRRRVLEIARSLNEQERGALVLLVDDAGSLPIPTARALGAMRREAPAALRIVLAATDDAGSSRAIVAVHPDIADVHLAAPMTRRETQCYVGTRLEQAGLPDAYENLFQGETLDWVHRVSGGVPRRVHLLGSCILDGRNAAASLSWDRTTEDDAWLGAPIDEAPILDADDMEDRGWLDEVDGDVGSPDLLADEEPV